MTIWPSIPKPWNYSLALKIRIKILGPEHPDVARIYNNIGYSYKNLGVYSKALEHFEEALKIQLQAFGEAHPDVAINYGNIGEVYNAMGDYAAAVTYYSKSLQIRTDISDKSTIGQS